MDIILTDWATQSYADLKKKHMFTDQEYWDTLRPDTLKLKQFPGDPHFGNSNKWGPANKGAGQNVSDGFKLKWTTGPGNNELRVMVAILGQEAFICQGYVKTKPQHDYREALNLEVHISNIRLGRYIKRGELK